MGFLSGSKEKEAPTNLSELTEYAMSSTPGIDEATSILKRMDERRKALLASRDSLRLQLNGIENQLFLIDQLLHPEPPEPNPDAPPAPPPDGHV